MIGRNRPMVPLEFAIYFVATSGFVVLWYLVWFSNAYTALNWPDTFGGGRARSTH